MALFQGFYVKQRDPRVRVSKGALSPMTVLGTFGSRWTGMSCVPMAGALVSRQRRNSWTPLCLRRTLLRLIKGFWGLTLSRTTRTNLSRGSSSRLHPVFFMLSIFLKNKEPNQRRALTTPPCCECVRCRDSPEGLPWLGSVTREFPNMFIAGWTNTLLRRNCY